MKNLLTKITQTHWSTKVTGAGAIVGLLAFAALSASAADPVTITASIQDGTNSSVTSMQIGTSVHASMLLASSTGPVATGIANFNRFQNTTCAGTATVESGVTVAGNTARSATTTVPNTGLSYTVHYNGNADYPAIDSGCVSVVATASSTALATNLSTTTAVYAGSSIQDSATLTNATSNAGGSVTYTVYNNNACTTGAISAGTGAVTSGVVGNSSSILFNIPGTYYWQAVYHGDAQNAIATSSCGSEVLTVLSTSTPANTAPVIQLLGANPFNIVLGQTFTDPGASSTDAQDGDLTSHIVVTGGPVNTSVLGTTTLTYTVTDAGSLSAHVTRTVVVSATAPVLGPGVISGNLFKDENRNFIKDGSEVGLAGWSINLYKGAGWWGPRHKNVPIQTATTDVNGNYSFTGLADGTYSVEEINKKGWIQETGDFRSIVIKNGVGKTDANFANASTTKVKEPKHDPKPEPKPKKNKFNFHGYFDFGSFFGHFVGHGTIDGNHDEDDK